MSDIGGNAGCDHFWWGLIALVALLALLGIKAEQRRLWQDVQAVLQRAQQMDSMHVRLQKLESNNGCEPLSGLHPAAGELVKALRVLQGQLEARRGARSKPRADSEGQT